jgi:hypothetical protein
MRKLIYGMMIAAGAGFGINSIAIAAPVNGPAIKQAVDTDLLVEPIHCKRYLPHRHMGAKPHGFGFGCPKKVRAARSKRT